MRSLALALVFGLLLPVVPSAAFGEVPADAGVLPGRPAPPLQVSQWLRGEPVESFRPGHVYVVDLWATWCTPCRATLARTRAEAEAHPEDLTVIALNVWENNPRFAPDFVEARADSMPFVVALDEVPTHDRGNGGLTAQAWIGDSAWVRMPRSYIVDRQGRIAWIGDPREIDGPLEAVLDGSWEIEPFARAYRADLAAQAAYRTKLAEMKEAIAARQWHRALQACEAAAAADTTRPEQVARDGFVLLGTSIFGAKPDAEQAALAQTALERALDLLAAPDWRLSFLAAQAARLAGHPEAARAHLRQALAGAPEGQRAALEAFGEAETP